MRWFEDSSIWPTTKKDKLIQFVFFYLKRLQKISLMSNLIGMIKSNTHYLLH